MCMCVCVCVWCVYCVVLGADGVLRMFRTMSAKPTFVVPLKVVVCMRVCVCERESARESVHLK